MFPKRDIPYRIPIARRVLGREVAKLVPIPAAVELAVPSRFVPKSVERGIVCIAHHGLREEAH